MKTETASRPRKASIAADPVSPDVAPTIVTRSPRARQRRLEQLADELHREVLEGQRRPVEQLEQEVVRLELLQRRARLVAEARVGRAISSANSSSVKASPMKGRMTRKATSS
jgi:hypothetical protein